MSWPKLSLETIVKIVGGGTPSKNKDEFWNGDIPWISIKDLKGSYISDSADKITVAGLANSAANLIPSGNIVVPTRMALGKVVITMADVAINQDLKALIIKDKSKVDLIYLAKYLESQASNIVKQGKGATVKGITLDVLKSIQVPLPPLDVQKQIAAVLEKADTLRNQCQQMEQELNALAQSVFLDMFGDPVTNPKQLPQVPISELGEVQTGSTPKRSVSKYWGGEIPWIKTGEVINNVIKSSEEFVTSLAISKTNCKVFPKGTILLAMYGQGKTRGRVGLLDVEASTNQACAAILPSKQIEREFLFAYLKLQYEQLRSLGRGGNQENLNLSMVKSFKVLVPSKDEQLKFINFLEKLNFRIDNVCNMSREVNALFNSFMQRAFKGELELKGMA